MNVIARDLKLSYSILLMDLNDKERIHEAVKGSAPMHRQIMKQWTEPVNEMEKLL